ncbi:MAG: CotH kinase family protein [Bacteroidota bacterium]
MTFLLIAVCVALTSAVIAQDKNENDLYSLQRVHEIRIVFSQDNWASVLDSLRFNGDGLLTGEVSIDGQKYNGAGVRYRGSKSFRVGNKRNALHIKLNYQNENQNHQGYKTLKLSNALRDPSMVREVLGYEIAGKYMDAPRASYTRVHVNDQYYGLFVNVEAVDAVFLNKKFGSSENTFVKCSPSSDEKAPSGCKQNIYASLEFETNLECYKNNYELKSATGWEDLMNLTKTLHKNPKDIESILEVDKTLWMLAFNNVIVNLSSYSGQHSQNFYLYKNNQGRFVPIIWDLNLSFGSYKNTGEGSDLNFKNLVKLDPLIHADNPYKPLISQLLQNEVYKKMYLSHIRTILYDNFMDNGYEQRAKKLQQLIYQAFYNDPNKTYTVGDFERSLYSTIGRRSKIPGIYSLMNKRAKYLRKNSNLKVFPPEVAEVNVLKRKQYSTEQVTDYKIQVKTTNKAKQVKVFYRFQPAEEFRMAYLKDDGNSNDEQANDEIFGGTIASNGNGNLEYYIVAENAMSLSFDPPNYMFEKHQVSLEQLNN